jgi:regulator of protease activity HflC (stomatin/prohibitin superfamily)
MALQRYRRVGAAVSPEDSRQGRVPHNAWLQAGGLVFLAVYGVALLAAFAWLKSNVREIPPQSRAIVVRFGALHRVQNAGLLLALPRPFEEVILLPSEETIIEQDMKVQRPPPQAPQAPPPPPTGDDEEEAAAPPPQATAPVLSDDATASIGNRLTGDAGVVQMDVTVFYTVVDPYEYVLEKAHIAAALERLASRSVVRACASRDVDAILVARPELIGVSSQLAEQRERLRGEVMQDINHSLAQLHAAGAGLGIELRRVDLIASLHPDTVDAFNSVLTASQQALQTIADARTESERLVQTATEDADRTLETARANASERLAKAQADTADVLQLADAIKSGLDAGLLPRIYRERIAAVLSKTTSLTVVNPGDDAHLIIQGAEK